MTASASIPSTRSCAKTMSWRWPGEAGRRTGRPNASVAAWIWVLKPPGEWPWSSAFAPFDLARARGMLMGTHDRGIDHQPFEVGFPRQHAQHIVENAPLDPAIRASLHSLIMPNRSGRSRQRPPERAIHSSASQSIADLKNRR